MTPLFARSVPDRPAGFTYPDNLDKTDWVDKELGTVSGLGDNSPRTAGYEAMVNGADIQFRKIGTLPWTTIRTVAGVSPNISFTFDQLMRPMVSYQVGVGINRVFRTGFLYWYDTTLLSYQTISVANIKSPVLTFDFPADATATFAEASWWYVRAGSVCYRKQSDRFTIEYVFAAMPSNQNIIATVGLSRGYRLQVQLEP